MSIEAVIEGLVVIGLLAYLSYSLIYPEKF